MLPVNISKKEREEMTHKISYDVLSRIALLARSRGLRDFDYAVCMQQHHRRMFGSSRNKFHSQVLSRWLPCGKCCSVMVVLSLVRTDLNGPPTIPQTTIKEHGRLEVEAAEYLVSELPPYKRYVQYKKLQGLNALSSSVETDFHNAYQFLLSVSASRIGCQPGNLAKAVELLELYVFGGK